MQVKCINIKKLPRKDVAPPLELNKEYTVKAVTKDKKDNDHYDVGLVSAYNYVTSQETGETLPNSAIGGIHWCHPSRFEILNN